MEHDMVLIFWGFVIVFVLGNISGYAIWNYVDAGKKRKIFRNKNK